MIYYGADIGGNTGFTAFNTINNKVINESVLDTRALTEEAATALIIDKILEIAVRYPTRKHIIVSEQFIASRTMKADVFRSARIESMVRFYFKSMGGKSKFEYHNQPPQKRLPFISTARTWVKASTKEGRCHIVDSFAHILASLHDKGIKIPANHKTVKKQQELKIENYEGGFKL